MDPLLQPRPVSPYSLRGVASAVGGAYGNTVGAVTDMMERTAARFQPPPGYTPALATPPAPVPVVAPPVVAPMPAPQPQLQLGGVNLNALQRREAAAGLKDGGMVPGYSPTPSADNIPIAATAGEAVLPVDTTQALGGKPAIDKLIAATHTPVAMGPGRAAQGKGRGIQRRANGGVLEEEKKRRDQRMLATVPSAGPGAAAAPAPYQQGPSVETRLPEGPPIADSKPASTAPVRASMPGAEPAADEGMSYGDQMSHVGGFIADAVGTGVKHLVGFPGYGINQSAGAPAAPAPTAAAAPAQAQPAAGPDSVRERRFVNASGQPVAPPPLQASTMGNTAPPSAQTNVMASGASLAPSMDAQLAGAQRAALARGESLGPSAAANLPAGYGASVMPDHAAEHNKQFDREVMLADAKRMGGRGAGRIMDFLSTQDRIAAETANTGTREAAATGRTQMVETGANDRQREQIAATDRREGPINAAKTTEAQVSARGKVILQKAQEDYQKAVAGGDAKVIQAAEDGLRAAQGKWEKPDTYGAVAVPGGVDPATGLATGSSVAVYNKASGEMKPGLSPAAARNGGVAPSTRPIGTVSSVAGKKAVWDGKQWVPQ